MSNNEDNSYHKINLNCEEWANAKLPESIDKS